MSDKLQFVVDAVLNLSEMKSATSRKLVGHLQARRMNFAASQPSGTSTAR